MMSSPSEARELRVRFPRFARDDNLSYGTTMQIAMIGLGKMGGNMTERLLRNGHKVVAFDRAAESVDKYAKLGASPAKDLPSIGQQLEAKPRVVWIMVPAGKPVDDTIAELLKWMTKGDIIIDGGNSNFHETMRRAKELEAKGISFIDSGTSGGIWGLENGYCLMVGGAPDAVKTCEPIFLALAPKDGYAHVGPSGAGHYVKMIHNGIEYGMLQAYAEGYEILHASKDFPKLDLHQIADVWQHGSVVRSWLNELAVRAFEKDQSLSHLKGFVSDSGEGRWTVQEAIDMDVPAPVITLSLLMRFRSRQDDTYSGKVIAALRNEFGGHAVKR
jgi:6-phosphogluconate dehydrogenase